jgi:histidyl-tRNA synthetase
VFPAPTARSDAFVIDVAGGAHALELTHALRAAGIRADRAFDDRSMKAQMKQADRVGARFALFLSGADRATLRDMTSGEEREIDPSRVAEEIAEKLPSQ